MKRFIVGLVMMVLGLVTFLVTMNWVVQINLSTNGWGSFGFSEPLIYIVLFVSAIAVLFGVMVVLIEAKK